MFTGLGSLSIVKRDTANQRTPAIGFQKTQFATKASANDTQINLASLTTPPEMTANGFTNPSFATLSAAQLLFYRKNLKLWSSLRGDLADYYQYYISSSTIITFVGFTAEEGEIFVGTIDYNATTGSNVVATVTPPATGSLTAGTTDFNTGFPFQIGLYPTQQSGAVYVYRNGQIQVRNTGNATASVSADGDYQEVDNGSGMGTIIRFNRPDPDNAGTIVVVPSGRLYELPNASMTATLEAIQGQVNSMAAYVAAALGQTVTTILGSAPTQQDLKAFGDRVLALENNRARIDLTNTFTAYQQIPGRTDGSAIGVGYIGESFQTFISNQVVSVSTNTYADIPTATLPLNPGVYLILLGAKITAGTLGAGDGRIAIRNSANTVLFEREYQESISSTITQNVSITVPLVIASATTLKLSFYCEGGSGGTVTLGSGSSGSYFNAVRIG